MQPQPDLIQARKVQQQLKAIFQLRAGGRTDAATLLRVRALCAIASRSVKDTDLKEKMGQVQNYAGALFSERKHQRWARDPLSGVEYLRRQVFATLDACDTRLQDIVAVRQTAIGAEQTSGESR
ncbi:MAG TPA: hypothetical protein VL280_09900 [Burkholderiales bacterium]|jgi:hypothetical protein|nr:hypothetical protein [Burkholderiales bacterium]